MRQFQIRNQVIIYKKHQHIMKITYLNSLTNLATINTEQLKLTHVLTFVTIKGFDSKFVFQSTFFLFIVPALLLEEAAKPPEPDCLQAMGPV